MVNRTFKLLRHDLQSSELGLLLLVVELIRHVARICRFQWTDSWRNEHRNFVFLETVVKHIWVSELSFIATSTGIQNDVFVFSSGLVILSRDDLLEPIGGVCLPILPSFAQKLEFRVFVFETWICAHGQYELFLFIIWLQVIFLQILLEPEKLSVSCVVLIVADETIDGGIHSQYRDVAVWEVISIVASVQKCALLDRFDGRI